ncbi:PqqD family protein [Terricaulis silvestris]|uniref:Coenzyme PQQ synthesis protein D (PqqD) n=1 Tax=Terricaulis silvestris TaxID=2686094 RepID=A0A6I6MGI1_9CAUL|nr:PqqD family protein [Terricaulis silvestris]QGZ93389.1 hypothetical protein DSM104635_00199 [Terricaulis silvestris]
MSIRYEISDQVISREVGEEAVILDLESGTYFGLATTGARIWQLIGQGKTLQEICDLVAGEYEVSRAELLHDLIALAQDLTARGVIRARPSNA